jgi:SAM-dependent methyltransferase
LISACPLCGAQHGDTVARFRYAAIWDELELQWGARFTDAVRNRHTPDDVAELRRCGSCGIDWFVGAIQGDAEFYRNLMAQAPYVAARWEFGRVRARLGASDRVVDFGSGDGEFLRSLSGDVARRAAVDHNPDAVRRMAVDGIEASAVGFAAFAEEHEGEFSVATAFQIVEHVEQVADVVAPALRSLGRRGRLFVSVPDRERLPEAELEPLDCPPHHLSRWSSAQLHALANRFDLRIVRLDRQPPDYGKVLARVMAPVDARLGGRPRSTTRRVARAAVRHSLFGPRRHRLLARAGVYTRLKLHGHTMLAEMVRDHSTRPPEQDC